MEFTKDSKLRQTMEQVCQEVLGKELQKILCMVV